MGKTKTEEGHDNIIKKMLRRMVENNLFVKYVWKAKEVRF